MGHFCPFWSLTVPAHGLILLYREKAACTFCETFPYSMTDAPIRVSSIITAITSSSPSLSHTLSSLLHLISKAAGLDVEQRSVWLRSGDLGGRQHVEARLLSLPAHSDSRSQPKTLAPFIRHENSALRIKHWANIKSAALLGAFVITMSCNPRLLPLMVWRGPSARDAGDVWIVWETMSSFG